MNFAERGTPFNPLTLPLKGLSCVPPRVCELSIKDLDFSDPPAVPSVEALPSFVFCLFFFFWMPHSLWSFQVRDQIQAAVVTYVTAAAMPDP